MRWKTIKCKGCNTDDGRMFMMPKAKSGDDVFCEGCKDKEIEKRAKE